MLDVNQIEADAIAAAFNQLCLDLIKNGPPADAEEGLQGVANAIGAASRVVAQAVDDALVAISP